MDLIGKAIGLNNLKLLACLGPLIAAALLAGPGSARARTDFGPLSPKEGYVLQQVGAGLMADLNEKFGPEDRARVLRGVFLEVLLTNEVPNFKTHRRGVALKNAVINDYVDLLSAEVPLQFFRSLSKACSRFKVQGSNS